MLCLVDADDEPKYDFARYAGIALEKNLIEHYHD